MNMLLQHRYQKMRAVIYIATVAITVLALAIKHIGH